MAFKQFELKPVKLRIKKRTIEVWAPSHDDDAIEVEIPDYDADFLPASFYFMRKCQQIVDKAMGKSDEFYPEVEK